MADMTSKQEHLLAMSENERLTILAALRFKSQRITGNTQDIDNLIETVKVGTDG